MTLERIGEQLSGWVSHGIDAVKIKVGRNPDVMLNPLPDMWAPDYATATLETDVEREGRIDVGRSELFPPEIEIRFVDTYETLVRATEELDVARDLLGALEGEIAPAEHQ